MGDDINNWGRWGPDDELGAANLITPEVTVGAAGLVRKGKVYSLASVIREAGAPRLEFRAANQHFVRVFAGPEEGAFVADDVVVLGCHGSSTHIDALCHYWADDKLYNGYPGSLVEGRGARKLGMQMLRSMVARGVMLDLAAMKGVDYLEGGYVITPQDLEDCCRRQGAEIRSGDVVLLRTGWPKTYAESAAKYNATQPGVDWESGTWLCRRDIAALGCDNSAIGARRPEPLRGGNVHVLFLHQAGVYLIEMMELDELSRDGVYEFMFMLAPLPVLGATGSTVNPLAIV